ncbi:beta-ketoacyl synthase chain length factor [Halomonas sp. HP20-15]|uniref:beta-ketoacyl synthase chain length factor n=1 Tax=Halomonas sp. HP20-15 TaxID=3085901 RepID=UPI002982AC67|nr:beta-ketoacyl synthase chain length factor [Halomonas sp. HP20-15]MDW5377475.1 beta-ketoacyl synthase chain length factor [Halomonas sp. HP20-15]
MTTVPLLLHDWRAWQPPGQQSRATAGDPRLSTVERPSGQSLPAMLRRRLNALGRAVCDMLAELDPAGTALLIHASRHGDGERTLELLYALAEGDALSPARFGMSVHNAILGVHSIASGNRRSLQALAASGDELAALFSEVRGYLAEGAPQVIAVFSDDPVPARFAEFAPPSRGTAAVALAFTSERGRRVRSVPAAPAADPRSHGAAQPADVIDWLVDGAPLRSLRRGLAWQLDD